MLRLCDTGTLLPERPDETMSSQAKSSVAAALDDNGFVLQDEQPMARRTPAKYCGTCSLCGATRADPGRPGRPYRQCEHCEEPQSVESSLGDFVILVERNLF
jgi:hypothetical protein